MCFFSSAWLIVPEQEWIAFRVWHVRLRRDICERAGKHPVSIYIMLKLTATSWVGVPYDPEEIFSMPCNPDMRVSLVAALWIMLCDNDPRYHRLYPDQAAPFRGYTLAQIDA